MEQGKLEAAIARTGRRCLFNNNYADSCNNMGKLLGDQAKLDCLASCFSTTRICFL